MRPVCGDCGHIESLCSCSSERAERQATVEAKRMAEIAALKVAAAAVDRRLGAGTALRILVRGGQSERSPCAKCGEPR